MIYLTTYSLEIQFIRCPADVREVDTITSVNTDDIAYHSGIVKDNVVRSHATFQQLTRDILWLNVTIHGQSVVYMAIRQIVYFVAVSSTTG